MSRNRMMINFLITIYKFSHEISLRKKKTINYWPDSKILYHQLLIPAEQWASIFFFHFILIYFNTKEKKIKITACKTLRDNINERFLSREKKTCDKAWSLITSHRKSCNQDKVSDGVLVFVTNFFRHMRKRSSAFPLHTYTNDHNL